MYHEIRHAWQFENNLFQDEKEIDTIDGDFESYLSLPYEKDAYRFQDENMKKYGEEILRIFGFQLKINYRLADEIRNIIYS
ncbi:hypothetical protein ORL62_21805 [Bacillus cereus]|uniref:hypothetical protein n=1 Tax=Bacillus cereus TaxID=1396 RepID=UPI000FE2F8C2|nr:hypothetical protein [Bacillus cereus]MDZ4410536.1 hypothetical protein [Bacillus cereus]MDZ4588378.1 hypothetical protein [Bacillus cereus]